jgi:UDP-N-acetylmuramate: L-alanyl-gamma-D-glutamyl-meso-diaminopimelate ligase
MKKVAAQKHIHIVGICGVGTGALAVAFHKAGWKVTGSDKGIYPPVSTNLTEAGIEYYTGWHPEKFEAATENGGIGRPNIVMVGGAGTSLSNPEIMYAKEHGIPFHPYAEILNKYFIRQNSIVTVGTWGKTTTSALMSYILIQAGMKPSYFTGGLSLSHPTGALTENLGEKSWSIVEGDEYQVAIYDKRPKFVYYNPTHLLLTSVSWDHADLYPTEADYFKTFENLVRGIPVSSGETKNGAQKSTIVACIDNEGVMKTLTDAGRTEDAITYGISKKADYRYHSVTHTKAGISFDIDHADSGQTWHISSPMLGRFNAENIAGTFAMAHHIGIPAETIIAAIANFKGIKRRLERRLDGEKDPAAGGKGITVLDCHAPTAEKAASVLESIREVYTKKIIAIYEPNIGGRQRASITTYNSAFKNADVVLLPHFTKLKIDLTKADSTDKADIPLEAPELAAYISKTNPNVAYIEDDVALIAHATAEAKKGDVIAFLGSHGFRGMIEETIKQLQK